MNKLFLIFVITSLLIFSACGTEEMLDKSTVLENATEAVETLDSYSLDMIINVDVMDMETSIEGTGDVTHDPDAMHLTMSMGMPGMTMDMETYIQENEAYMSMFGEWFNMGTEEMELDSFDQLNKEEMEKLARFSEDFEMTEEDSQYVLTLSGEGDEYSELVDELVQSSMGDFPADPTMGEQMQNITVNSIDLEVRIDKESFLMMSQKISADIEMEGEPMQLDGDFNISNINGVEPIVVPEEIKENATEDFMGDSFGYEETMSIEEIQELVDFPVPQVTGLPEGYSLIDSWYDETMGMVMLNYEKDFENGVSLSVYPSEEEYGAPFEEATETVTINGNEATLHDMHEFLVLTWEQNGLFLELSSWGQEISKEEFVELAENVE
ncbi:DUF4367 domain-containing protein [Aquibacillus albus]|uniref:DUF4367 domain-containing protein n=1 Tax=Aquibacillus albus TaxID=1168171 RepID=A0ABS2MZP4_9BACI|nr:DUF4367 domain-containing protein [Aquibacillus albus]MBM7571319.1 hypothetical protein [Aquibacillus albus]